MRPDPAYASVPSPAIGLQVLQDLQERHLMGREVPEPYSQAGIVRQLVRVVIDQGRRLAWLEGHRAPEAARADAPVPAPEEGQLPPPVPRQHWRAARRAGTPGLPQLVGEVLASVPGRWWTTREIADAVNARAVLALTVSPGYVSRVLSTEHVRHGWTRRPHPGNACQLQWAGQPVAVDAAGGGA